MSERFIPGKRYIFSKDKWLADTGNVLLYKSNPYLRQAVDKADGKEVERIEDCQIFVSIDGLIATPEHCDIIESKRRTTFREAVNRLLLEDKHAQLHEVINMLCSERKRLEQRIKAIDKVIAKREQELYEVDKELIEKWTSS